MSYVIRSGALCGRNTRNRRLSGSNNVLRDRKRGGVDLFTFSPVKAQIRQYGVSLSPSSSSPTSLVSCASSTSSSVVETPPIKNESDLQTDSLNEYNYNKKNNENNANGDVRENASDSLLKNDECSDDKVRADGEKQSSSSRVLVVGASGRTGRRVVKQLYDRVLAMQSDSSSDENGGTKVEIVAGGRAESKLLEALREVGIQESCIGESSSSSDTDSKSGNTFLSTSVIDLVASSRTSSSVDPNLANALSDVDTIVCCVGANEGPELLIPGNSVMEVENNGVIALINAAKHESSSVKRFVLVTSLGTGRFGLPASLLNSGGLLDCKREAELALISSGIDFTIIRPGGMERPKDDFKETHSTRLYAEDTTFGGLISRLQIAELCAEAALDIVSASTDSNSSSFEVRPSSNKIVEAIAEEGKSERPAATMFNNIEPHPGVIKDNTLEAFTAKYDYAVVGKKTVATTFLDSMSFSGSLPELLNGRLAMIGFVEALEAEMLGKGTVVEQLQMNSSADVMYDIVIGIIIGLVVIGSIIPINSKNLLPEDANWGPFNSFVEMLHCRLAMIGFVTVLYLENTHHTPMLKILPKLLTGEIQLF